MRRLRESGLSAIPISTVHDSIYLDVEHERDLQTITNMCHQVFDDLPINFRKLFGVEWRTPLNCEVHVGPDMKNMEEIGRNDNQMERI